MFLKTNLHHNSICSTVFPGFLWYTKFNYRIYTNKIYCKKIFTNVFKFFTSFATRTCNKIKFNFRLCTKKQGRLCTQHLYRKKTFFLSLLLKYIMRGLEIALSLYKQKYEKKPPWSTWFFYRFRVLIPTLIK